MTLFSNLSNITRSEGDPKVLQAGASPLATADRLARGLGWFSIGLGLTELMAPRAITHSLGMRGREGLVRAFGLRELGHGVMSLSVDKQVGVWSRVGGDILDIAAVLPALSPANRRRGNAEVALLLLLGITAVDLACARGVTAGHARKRGAGRSYASRSGFPKGLQEARGAARRDFETPPDMQAPPAMARAVA